MYNPFKAHLAQLRNGFYAIRRLTLIGYEFLDCAPKTYWWQSEYYVLQHCKFNTIGEAQIRLEQYQAQVKNRKQFSKRVEWQNT